MALFGLDARALGGRMVEIGEPAWRGRQLAEAMYRQRVAELDQVTTLAKPLRNRLVNVGWIVGRPRIVQTFVSNDGTERYLVEGQSQGAQTVEAVWMPDGDGGEAGDGSGADLPKRLRKQERKGMGARNDLRLQPSGMRGELPILFDGETRVCSAISTQAKLPGR